VELPRDLTQRPILDPIRDTKFATPCSTSDSVLKCTRFQICNQNVNGGAT
jgi:hypothetical protein